MKVFEIFIQMQLESYWHNLQKCYLVFPLQLASGGRNEPVNRFKLRKYNLHVIKMSLEFSTVCSRLAHHKQTSCLSKSLHSLAKAVTVSQYQALGCL